MNTNRILGSIASLVRAQWLGLLALILVLSGGAAYAAVAKDSVVSKSIKNGQVKMVDLKDGAVTTPKLALDAVTTAQVANGTLTGTDLQDNSVTGADVIESSLGTVNNATTVGGIGAAALMRSTVYKRESAVTAGTALGDGTFVLAAACDAGDLLLSGGPANVNPTSDMVESFPSPGSTTSWSARIDKNAAADNFSVVVVCVDQTP